LNNYYQLKIYILGFGSLLSFCCAEVTGISALQKAVGVSYHSNRKPNRYKKKFTTNITTVKTSRNEDKPTGSTDDLSSQKFYHGTKANLKQGDLIEPGFNSNYGKRKKASYVYLTATLDAAIWGAELAFGEEPGRIYTVRPTGPIEDDPNLTDKKFPGNPTKSYRSQHPLQVIGEIRDWQGHSPEQLKAMKEHLEQLKQLGIEAIDD
jgi:hypothetical protein